MEFSILKREEINIREWDRSIDSAFNGNIYGYSWFLDIVCESWYALVNADYSICFPLPVYRKYGLNVIYHPEMIAQLGIFSKALLDEKIINTVLKLVAAKFGLIHTRLNKFVVLNNNDKYGHTPCYSYEIDLISNKKSIYNAYSQDVRKNLDRAFRNKLVIIKGIQPNDLIRFICRVDVVSTLKISNKNIIALRKIMSTIYRLNTGQVYTVFTADNSLCAIGLFLYSHNKIHVQLLASNHLGIESHALELLIHTFFYTNAEKNVTLSFNESDNKLFTGIYKGFGTRKNEFLEIKRNSTIWPIDKLLLRSMENEIKK